MNTDRVRVELEQEQTWRRDEMRFLRNLLAEISGVKQKQRYRKSLVVMLYSHYEGFCKFAMDLYVKSVNDQKLACASATAAVVAGAWHDVFVAVESGDKKGKLFKSPLPSDEGLHRYARRRDFVEQLEELGKLPAAIPPNAVQTESNLWPVVLRKNLFRIGLKHEAFTSHDGEISQLLHRRNDVAHGSQQDGILGEVYDSLERAVFAIMEQFMELVIEALRCEEFRKPAAGV